MKRIVEIANTDNISCVCELIANDFQMFDDVHFVSIPGSFQVFENVKMEIKVTWVWNVNCVKRTLNIVQCINLILWTLKFTIYVMFME